MRRQGAARLAGAIVRETLAVGGRACRPLIAREGLGATLIEPALALLRQRGTAVRFEHQLRAIRFSAERIEALEFGGETITLNANDSVVLAVPPYAATAMVDGLKAPTEFRAIVNAHFRIEPPAELPPILGVLNAACAVDLFVSGPRVGHHQRRRSSHRHATRRIGRNRSGMRSRA